MSIVFLIGCSSIEISLFSGKVHQSHTKKTSEWDPTPLYYRVGTLSADKKSIIWGSLLLYHEDGMNPSLSINGNKLIEVHHVPHLDYVETKPVYPNK